MKAQEPEGGRMAWQFAGTAVLLLLVGVMIGVNIMQGAAVAAGFLGFLGGVNVYALVALYRSSLRLVRVQERLARGGSLGDAASAAWPPLPRKPIPPPAPPPKTP